MQFDKFLLVFLAGIGASGERVALARKGKPSASTGFVLETDRQYSTLPYYEVGKVAARVVGSEEEPSSRRLAKQAVRGLLVNAIRDGRSRREELPRKLASENSKAERPVPPR